MERQSESVADLSRALRQARRPSSPGAQSPSIPPRPVGLRDRDDQVLCSCAERCGRLTGGRCGRAVSATRSPAPRGPATAPCRNHNPSTFTAVVGQKHSIRPGRIPHLLLPEARLERVTDEPGPEASLSNRESVRRKGLKVRTSGAECQSCSHLRAEPSLTSLANRLKVSSV